MKKLLSIALVGLVLVGCGSDDGGSEDKYKTMTCSMDRKAPGVEMTINIDYKYEENIIYQQIQKSEIKVEKQDVYETLFKTMADMDFAGKLDGMDGVKYSLTKDDTALEINENLDVKFGEITADDYKVITNDKSDVTGEKKILLQVDKTIESMEAQGLECSK